MLNFLFQGGLSVGWIEKFRSKSFDFYKQIVDLPPAAKFILYILDTKKILNRSAIEKETLLPKRTVGSALKILLKKGFVKKISGNELKQLDMFYHKRIDFREAYYQISI